VIRVRCQHPRPGAAARRVRSSARRFLAALGCGGAELSILLAGDAALRRLNREWRGIDRATDVLSFPAAPDPRLPRLGDLAISLDTARRRARAGRRRPGAELDRYLAHGVLHLLGFDHEQPGPARRMAAFEERLLAGQGMVGEAMWSGPPTGPGPAARAPRPGRTEPRPRARR